MNISIYIYLHTHGLAGKLLVAIIGLQQIDSYLSLIYVCISISGSVPNGQINQSHSIKVLCNIALLISLVLFPAIGAPQGLKMIYLQYDMRIQGGTFRFWYHSLMLSAIVSKTNTASHTRSHKFHPALPKPKGSRAWPPSARVVA